MNFTVESSPETLLFLKSTDTVLSQLFEKFYDPLTWVSLTVHRGGYVTMATILERKKLPS